jgi:hypothetical protein
MTLGIGEHRHAVGEAVTQQVYVCPTIVTPVDSRIVCSEAKGDLV